MTGKHFVKRRGGRAATILAAALVAGTGGYMMSTVTPAAAVSGNPGHRGSILHCGFAYPGWPTGAYECWNGTPPANFYPPTTVTVLPPTTVTVPPTVTTPPAPSTTVPPELRRHHHA